MSSNDLYQSNRTSVYISLFLALSLVAGALGGAKVISERAANAPIAVSELPAPLADSAVCADLLETLPSTLAGLERATIAEPVPAGVAAWADSPQERITIRCGVDLPAQYNEYAQTDNIGGVQYLRVDDETPQSTMTTWYSTDREAVVAITADRNVLDKPEETLATLDGVAKIPAQTHEPRPAPLASLSQLDPLPRECVDLVAALPAELGEWTLNRDTTTNDGQAVWVRNGREPIVLHCGVEPPEAYDMGAQLTQIDGIPWFQDTTLANGVTGGTWYALGRSTDIAVSIPQSAASEVLPTLTRVIGETTPGQEGGD